MDRYAEIDAAVNRARVRDLQRYRETVTFLSDKQIIAHLYIAEWNYHHYKVNKLRAESADYARYLRGFWEIAHDECVRRGFR